MRYEKLNTLIGNLYDEHDRDASLDIAIEIANEFMRIIFPDDERGRVWSEKLLEGDDLLDETIKASSFPNQKVATWFEKHPFLGGQRTAIRHFSHEDSPIESKFYWLNKSSAKSRIAAGVMLTPNWEDSEQTRRPDYKVGIDFFMTSAGDSLLVVLSNEGKLRVLELKERLSNTQIEILDNVNGAAGFNVVSDLEPQRTIHLTLWNAFALKEVNKKFYEGVAKHFQILLQHLHDACGKSEADSKIFANRLIGRLLFIWFLKKKGFINEDMDYFDCNSMGSTEYYSSRLEPLFFSTLNCPISERNEINGKRDTFTPYLNGGLFEAKTNDWRGEEISFPPDWFVSLYEHFSQFNFTTDESTPEFEQVAIDPEMLGKVFENLLASQLDETGKEARKASGSFYTPREIVSYMCKESLREYLYSKLGTEGNKEGVDRLLDMTDQDFEVKHSDSKKSLWGKERTSEMTERATKALDSLRVVDPACGSGAFPMGMLQLLSKSYERLGSSLNSYELKMKILGNNIYGIDIQPMAVEISRLRAWLSLIVDENDVSKVKPLPNLEFRFVCANTLVPKVEEGDYGQSSMFDIWDNDSIAALDEIMGKGFYSASDPEEKKKLREEYRYAVVRLGEDKKEHGIALQQRMAWNPFDTSASAGFFDSKIMFNLQEGFDIAIGNPPYIQLQKMKQTANKLYKPLGYKTYESTGDIYSLFYERGFQLLKEGGVLCYITSNKWMRAAYGESLRNYFLKETNPVRLVDFAGTKVFESATVDVNILLATKAKRRGEVAATIIREDCQNNLSNYVKHHTTPSVFAPGESWTVLTAIEQSIKRKIEAIGVPLKDWDISINYGIKTGCNEAFIIDGTTKDRLIAEDSKSAEIIRPILRGRDIKRFGYTFADQWLIATFPSRQYDIDDYPAVKKYLETFDIRKLAQSGEKDIDGIKGNNARKKTNNKWFETQDTIAYWDDFSKQKIIFQEMVQEPSFVLDETGLMLCNDTARIITSSNHSLPALLGVFNSKTFFYAVKTYYAGGGLGSSGVRMKHTFIMEFPMPPEDAIFDIGLIMNGCNSEPDDNLIERIEDILFKAYDFSDEERRFISSSFEF